jgi:tripartite-type tricarboxylate transporter receptor subunit TctC
VQRLQIQLLVGFGWNKASCRYAVGIRKGTPSEIVDKLNNQVNAALTDPELTAKLADFGNAAFPGSPAVLSKFVAEDTEKWATVIRAANIKPE